MTKLFAIANCYVQESDWKDIALIKICLFALGSLVGMQVTQVNKPILRKLALIGFVATYVPLMQKFICRWKNHQTTD